MRATAVPKATWMAAVAVGLVLAAGLVGPLAQASDPPSSSSPRAAADVPVRVTVGPAVRLKAGVSAGQVMVLPPNPGEPANGAGGGHSGAAPSTSVLVSVAPAQVAGERLQLSVFSNTPWMLFARATSGQGPTGLVLVDVQEGPGRVLGSPEEGHRVPQVTLAPGGVGMLLARSNRVGVTSLLYLVQPGTEGREGEAGPVELRFDLVSLGPG